MKASDKELLQELYDKVLGDIGKNLKEWFLQGFDTYEEYEKYGDFFINVTYKPPAPIEELEYYAEISSALDIYEEEVQILQKDTAQSKTD